VRARGVIQSPVLVGQDSFLALIEDRLAGAAAGEGGLLFVAGEAGIGKTRLLGIAGGYLGARMQSRLPDILIRRTVGILAIAIAAQFLKSGLG
jgi:uncharacterized membrane protein YfcA